MFLQTVHLGNEARLQRHWIQVLKIKHIPVNDFSPIVAHHPLGRITVVYNPRVQAGIWDHLGRWQMGLVTNPLIPSSLNFHKCQHAWSHVGGQEVTAKRGLTQKFCELDKKTCSHPHFISQSCRLEKSDCSATLLKFSNNTGCLLSSVSSLGIYRVQMSMCLKIKSP